MCLCRMDVGTIKQEAQRGSSEDFNTTHFPQYNPGSVALSDLLSDLGKVYNYTERLYMYLLHISD